MIALASSSVLAFEPVRIPPRAASPAKPEPVAQPPSAGKSVAQSPSAGKSVAQPSGPTADPTAPLPPTVVPAADLVVARSAGLIAAGKHREAFSILMEARARLGKVRDVRIEALLGRVALLENVPEKALEFVAPYTAALDKFDAFAAEAYLVAGDANLALGKNQQALEIFDWLAGKAEGETVILAAEGCGKALMAMKDYAKAAEAFQFAVSAAQAANDYKKYDKLIARLQGLLNQARRLADIGLYGEDFVLYRDAEIARRLTKDFKRAHGIYFEITTRFPQGPYADASQLYGAMCLIELGKVNEARIELVALRTANPYGLYSGEALLELGRIALEHDVQPKAARGCFLLLDTWIQEVKSKPVLNITKLAVPDAAKAVTTPPQEEKYVDFWGNVKKSEIKPGMLVNSKTCPWYLDDLKEQMAMYLGFLAFAEGKKDEALAWYAKILECDPQTRRMDTSGEWNDYSRLKWGAEHGYLYAYPQELALYGDPRQKLAVFLFDFYFVTEKTAKAESIAKRLLKGEFGPLRPAAREYPQFAYGVILSWQRDLPAAYGEFMKVVQAGGGRLNTFTQCRAAYSAANISRRIQNPAVQKQGQELFARLIAMQPANEFSYKARIEVSLDLINEYKWDEALGLLRTMPKDAGDFKALADFYLKRYEPMAKEYNEKGRSKP